MAVADGPLARGTRWWLALLLGSLLAQLNPTLAESPAIDKSDQDELETTQGKQGHIDAPIQATCDLPTRPPKGTVVDIYWTQGPENKRVVVSEVDHYVDLNLVIETSGYAQGDCVEAKIRADDGQEIVDGLKEIVLRGTVDDAGIAYFREPFRGYTLNLSGQSPDDPSDASRSAPN
ncbi:hypothetical protein [Aminobacter sp. MET-1]|uniref:hypothetical protein n=1 Tax=Aminobacter sp. MET-1 TaxID=2951085 RepID=UPI00226AA6F3|nr:hypothetical protein [Aminobacter sp. MET-1]MCX8569961.1 hypothetical protein [Aminobacter sp. MET-1]